GAGAAMLPPAYRHALVQLSRGGADATVVREFDVETRRFVADGFALPEAKTAASWLDADRLLVATPLGGDEFATESGYARTVRLWRRGTPFVEAPIVFECEREHIYAFGSRATEIATPRIFYGRALDFIHSGVFVEETPGQRRRIEGPTGASPTVFGDWLLVSLREDWQAGGRVFRGGSLLVTGFAAFMAGGRDFTVLFEPTEKSFLQGFDTTRGTIAFKVLDDVRSRI